MPSSITAGGSECLESRAGLECDAITSVNRSMGKSRLASLKSQDGYIFP